MLTEKAIELISLLVRKGIDWLFALRKVNGMSEDEIDAATAVEEKRSNDLMAEWNKPSDSV